MYIVFYTVRIVYICVLMTCCMSCSLWHTCGSTQYLRAHVHECVCVCVCVFWCVLWQWQCVVQLDKCHITVTVSVVCLAGLYITFKQPNWYLNFCALFMKNILFEYEMIQLW